jgi:hypothetical protein
MLLITGTGPERAPEVTVDPYIALSVDWPDARRPGSTLWWRFDGPRTMLETGFHAETAELVDVTLISPGPIARVQGGPPAAASTSPGIPRCDPAEWARRSPSGTVEEFHDRYVFDEQPLRTELGPDHLLIRIGAGDEPAARELVCGRARFGLSASDVLLWICVDGFSAEARALLDEHVAWSLVPPERMPPQAPPPHRPWWRRLLAGRGG